MNQVNYSNKEYYFSSFLDALSFMIQKCDTHGIIVTMNSMELDIYLVIQRLGNNVCWNFGNLIGKEITISHKNSLSIIHTIQSLKEMFKLGILVLIWIYILQIFEVFK